MNTIIVFNNRNYFAPKLIDIHCIQQCLHAITSSCLTPYIMMSYCKNDLIPVVHVFLLYIFPSIYIYLTLQDAAVAVGWNSMVLISLVDGRWLAEHSLPCQPDAPVVIGDLDGDGYNDYIVQCPNGYVGFSLLSIISTLS